MSEPLRFAPIEREDRALAQITERECIRPGTPLSLYDARRLVQRYVDRYNNVRLNSATGYITPKDLLAGRQEEIHAERDRKLEAARKQWQVRRQKPLERQIALRCAPFCCDEARDILPLGILAEAHPSNCAETRQETPAVV